MPGFHLYTGNRLEKLAERFAELVHGSPCGPFEKEHVVVQSFGMMRWLSMRLADSIGVSANCSFMFPNAMMESILGAVLDGRPADGRFGREVLLWRIMGLLPECSTMKSFAPVISFLGDDGPGGLKAWQLSSRIAYYFDQYLVYRPGLVLSWELGKDRHWQAELWRMLAAGENPAHAARRRDEFLARMETLFNVGLESRLQRISVFGISSLPPYHLSVLAACARHIDINLFFLNPCNEYWGDVRSPRARRPATGDPADRHYDTGNSLLSSMGTLGRDFVNLLWENDLLDEPLFEDPGDDTILHLVQSDILHMINRGACSGTVSAGSDEHPVRTFTEKESISFHSCHNPMREVEALRDYLVGLFDSNADLEPHEVLVMTPDIETYAPYIRAVFESEGDDAVRIPFVITDRSLKAESPLAESFFRVMGMAGGRFSATEVFSVLDCADIRRRFGLTDGIDRVRTWIIDTRVRWGMDAEHRRAVEGFPFEENTWRHGLDRLLLGYAMPGNGERMFGGILPYDDIEGSEAAQLGGFLDFETTLAGFVRDLGGLRTPGEWSSLLENMIAALYEPDDESERHMSALRRAVSGLSQRGLEADFQGRISLDVVNAWLSSVLADEKAEKGFLSGGVTFCAMLPMRSIPFRVICLIGMNDGVFPRNDPVSGFDLMQQKPAKGDRSRRNDDRHLFLETIISAREKLYISYIGQSVDDNTPRPPSVLVSELMDYLDQSCRHAGGAVRDALTVKHRLQAFNPAYFSGGPLYSYSRENLRACLALSGERRAAGPLFSGRIPPQKERGKSVSIDELVRFFRNPAEFFVRGRLGIRIDEAAGIINDRDPHASSGLERYGMGRRIMTSRLAGSEHGELFPLIRATGMLPHGSPGELDYAELARGVDRLLARIIPFTSEGELPPLDLEISVGEWRVNGIIRSVFPRALVLYRFASVSPGDRVSAWILHCALNASGAEGYPRSTLLFGRDGKAWELQPPDDPLAMMEIFVNAYDEGFRAPLPFFPGSSLAYAGSLLEDFKPREKALENARQTWKPDYTRVRGEGDDPYFNLCYGDDDPFGNEFESFAEKLLRPMIGCQRETE